MHAPAPRYATEPTPGSRSEGAQIAKLAQLLGRPLMPWQRQVVDVATELTEAGMYRYPTVMVTVPRQSGKTTLLGALQLHRIMTRSNTQAFFTAQTGKDGGDRMRDLLKIVAASPIAHLFKFRYAAGRLGLDLSNGSALSTFAPGPSALHGTTPHLVCLDEIWKHDHARGTELRGAIGPAQSTIEGEAQLWMVSTAGTADSGFMNELVEQGRAGTPNMAYFEWSLDDGLDPYEPQSWWTFHPALGNTISESYLAKEAADQPAGEWMRAYCNRVTSSIDPLVDPADFEALAKTPNEVPARSSIALTFEVGLDNIGGTVMASWRDTDGIRVSRVIHSAPGTGWMEEFLFNLYREWRPRVLGADDGGPNRKLIDKLRRRLGDDTVIAVGGKDSATAGDAWLTDVLAGEFKHDGTQAFTAGVAHLTRRQTGDVVSFSRAQSTGPIMAPMASAIGGWLYDHHTQTGTLKIHV